MVYFLTLLSTFILFFVLIPALESKKVSNIFFATLTISGAAFFRFYVYSNDELLIALSKTLVSTISALILGYIFISGKNFLEKNSSVEGD